MNILPVGFSFIRALCDGYATWCADNPAAEGLDESKTLAPSDAEFVLTMNNGNTEVMRQAQATARELDIPLCFWTIEDPNAIGGFMGQAMMADYVFTSDKACIPTYRQHLKHERVYWLPLAANEWLHKPMPLAEDAADFVFSGNWYDNQWEARKWGTETVILPLARAGYSMAIFSYEEPPYPELKPFWRGATSCYTTAEQYTHGRVVLGNNNQRSGMDGRDKTYMTSMRSYEALACGKPFLTSWSEAYEALGFEQDTHMRWIWEADHSVRTADVWLTKVPQMAWDIAYAGRAFVLANHTYGHRLDRIARAIAGMADPEDWG